MINKDTYKRLTYKNKDEFAPEYYFCVDCEYFGEPNGCNRWGGTCANYEQFNELYNRLAELEDKIMDGALLELPCKVGDKVYVVYGECGGNRCPYNGGFGQWRCNYKGNRMCNAFVDEQEFGWSMLTEINKTVFTDRFQAEAKLKELKGEEQ